MTQNLAPLVLDPRIFARRRGVCDPRAPARTVVVQLELTVNWPRFLHDLQSWYTMQRTEVDAFQRGWGFFLDIFNGFLGIFMVFGSVGAQVSRSVSRSVRQPTERSVSQSVGQPTERSGSQSVGRPAGSGESVSQSVGRPAAAVSQSASQYVYQPSRQSVGLLIWRYTCKPVSMEYRNRQMRGRV